MSAFTGIFSIRPLPSLFTLSSYSLSLFSPAQSVWWLSSYILSSPRFDTMKQHPGLLEKILPPPRGNFMIRADLDKGYKRFSRGLAQILMVSVLVPMTVIAILSHYQHRQLFEQKEQEQLFLHLKLSAGTIEKFVAELETVVQIVAVEDGYQELSNQAELAEIFARLHNEYPSLEGIEIIDTHGQKKSHFGWNHGVNTAYKDSPWYKKTLLQGIYISNMFIQHPAEPYFFIALSRKFSYQAGRWVVRVAFNANELQSLIDSVSVGYSEDLFLVDADFRLLTQPRNLALVNKEYIAIEAKHTLEHPLPDWSSENVADRISPQPADGVQISRHASQEEQQIIQAVTGLENIPWKLVLIKEQYLYGETWAKFKAQLTAIFIFCAGLAVLFVIEISKAITGHLREASLKREQFLARAEQPNKLASIGRLAAGVAHEINNPLAIIHQKAGLAQDFMEISAEFPHKKGVVESLEGIQKNVQRCKIITHRLLGFAHQTKVKIEQVDINLLLHEVIDFLSEEISYCQIRIVFELDRDIQPIFTDRGELLQVLLNITGNAIDAVGSDCAITLKSRQVDGKNVRIVIKDNGPGMSEEVQKQIFDPFFTTKQTGKGTGLGLSIVYGLVRKLGGSINVISAEDKGAAFEIDLPIRQ
ncbi:MAG: hypothetical protein D3923_03670 [Candidatus Electrothrix sp. AR3]|nr:hypothetical protein [Candidatus Electrothrix sp. AR3]